MRLGPQLLRFAAVGGLATLLHYALLVALVRGARLDAVLASSLGFACSAGLNYQLNRHLTFRCERGHRGTLARFAVVALAGMALNGLAMGLLSRGLGLHYLIAQLLATGLALLWNFTLSRYWTFAPPRRAASIRKEAS